ncbi:MAG TPA: ABC transporter permease [Actinomycetes bacterium]|nr:ABC transporter permease [Actinomycetes bacterium]
MSTVATTRGQRDYLGPLLRIWGVLVYIFLFAPIVVIVIYSFNTGRLLVSWDGFGFASYDALWQNSSMKNALWMSIRVALLSAVFATILGSLAGVALARRPGKWTYFFLAILALVLVTPEIVDAVALLPWFVWLGGDLGIDFFQNGLVRLTIGTGIFATAVVALIIRARMSGLDESLEESAADLYATPWNRFRQITLPLMMPAVIAAALLAFTLSLDNTIIASFITVAGSDTLPVYIFSSVRSALRPEVAAVSTVLLILTLAAIAFVAVVLRRGGDSSTQITQTMTGQA